MQVPALRERSEDIPCLAQEMLERMGAEAKGTDLSCLTQFEWPGNARQLKNFLIRAYVLGELTWEPNFLLSFLQKKEVSYWARLLPNQP